MFGRRGFIWLPLIAAACSDASDPPRDYPVPNYSYLSPLRFNVAAIELDDRTPPTSDRSLVQLSPLRPVDGLKQIANDRLVAAGSSGRAVFVIETATLQQVRGGVEGTLSVRIDVYASATSERSGYAEARITRKRTSNDTDEAVRPVLYELTTQMLNDMNVELEFQVKRSLRDWLQGAQGTAPLPPKVDAQDLGAPRRP